MPPTEQSRYYPPALREKEFARLRQRRGVHGRGLDGTDRLPDDAVGFALSGGGIRSATVCLGVFQKLAQAGLLKQIDFLSTVSGGGYFGGFLGAWLDRLRRAPTRWRLAWLAPLTPIVNWAAAKAWPGLTKGIAAPLGNLITWLKKPAPAVPAANVAFARVEAGLANPASFPNRWLRENGRYLAPNGAGDLWSAFAVALRSWISIHVILGAFFLFLFVVAQDLPGWLFGGRFVPHLPAGGTGGFHFVRSPYLWLAVAPAALALLCGAGYWCFSGFPRVRNRLTHWLAGSLLVTAAVLVYALIDAVGASLYLNRAHVLAALHGWYVQTGGLLAVLLLVGRRIQGVLERLSVKDRLNLPAGYLAAAAALGLGLVWAVAFATGGYALNGWGFAGYAPPWLVLLILSLFFALWPRFLNLSSQATLYEARLTRAYLGASNPERPHHQKISDTIPGDVVTYDDYSPDAAGGPIHLINVTVNETIDGRSQIEQRDRKGFPLVIGPCGLTAAATHHALWTDERRRDQIAPIDNGGFHCLAGPPGRPVRVRQYSLGGWVAISGAAFTTGLGSRTSMGLSFLLGFFNIRLGRWWDSGVNALARQGSWWQRLRTLPTAVFPVQLQLLNEFFARFHGSARQFWYLSDGGHFENTGAYELVRRRVPLIVVCDDGCDAGRTFDDFAGLVRKARVDFGAEITVLDERELDRCVQPILRRHFGTMSELRIDPATGLSGKHALLARVNYTGPDQTGWLLLLKPSLTGDEPVDVLNYWRNKSVFPQESTMDQFFDEAQWESYRRLGEHICDTILGAADPDQPLRASLLQAP